jgi:hypothetical protein
MAKQVYEIRELDIDKKIHPLADEVFNKKASSSRLVLLGSGGSGKSTLISWILYRKRKLIPAGLIMSGSEDSNHFYESFFPSTFIYSGLDLEILEQMKQRQIEAKNYLKNPWLLVLVDDCTDDPKLLKQRIFRDILKMGRHWSILFMLSLHYCLDVDPGFRSCIDGTFIFRDCNLKNRKSIYENYAGIIPTFKLFCSLMDQLTEDYMCMYIENRTNTNDWTKCVFWFKAKIPPRFEFGSRDFWDFHDQRVRSQNSATF